jgi:hypothetical protein
MGHAFDSAFRIPHSAFLKSLPHGFWTLAPLVLRLAYWLAVTYNDRELLDDRPRVFGCLILPAR